jgi:GT2 family glycosyltransferase
VNPAVHIIISVHDRKQATLKCLASLSVQTYAERTIIVVDDGSIDGTAESVRKEYPSTVLLRGDGNLWWTGATNLGIQHALRHAEGRDYVLTLNNDTVVRPNYLQCMLEAAVSHPKNLIGSITLSKEDESTIANGGVRINWLTAKYTCLAKGARYEEIHSLYPSLLPVDVLPGRGTLIPIEVFHRIGLYDGKNFPHYGADYEFSRRAKRNGYELLVNYEAVVISDITSTGMNNEVLAMSWAELRRSFFSIRSPYNLRYRWKFARLACPKPFLPSFFVFDAWRVFLGALRNQLRPRLPSRRYSSK